MLNGWPSRDPHNFRQFRPSDPSNPSKMAATTYCPTHSRTLPPPGQVISTKTVNILLRKMYQSEEKPTAKRGPPANVVQEQGCKQPRPTSDSDSAAETAYM
ncbi:hypothetical protein MLD38_038631 [Melastoma candidum]|uniref:Uncharacterized protein n=1 Tax=Melastoma candidum TaxID=119954 RepID=A0ACB9L046_9MYRT|nr:hypothetical protein MLD38_038631 [Melastoma candidum]